MTTVAPSKSGADTAQLPIADRRTTRRAALGLVRRDPRAFVLMLALSTLATAAGLAGPYLIGRIVNDVTVGTDVATVDRTAIAIIGFAVLQMILTRYSRLVAERFGERAAAHIREVFVDRTLSVPARVVERAALGDLAARATGDVTTVSATMRYAAPDVLIALVQTLLVLIAVLVTSPLLGLCGIVALSGIWFVSRWYLRRAREAYLAMRSADSTIAEVIAATAAGARTVEALGLQHERRAASTAAVETARLAGLRALRLRTGLFPIIDVSFVLPLVAVLLVGGVLYDNGSISLGAVVASALYLRQLAGPIDTFELWIDQLQSTAASLARLEGIAGIAEDPGADVQVPEDDRVELRGVHYAYEGRDDVLHGVDLKLEPGERLAVVGTSGAGKSTLARLIAGIDAPRAGTVTVGDIPVYDVPPGQLRHLILLVTQEHHVFRGTIRDNLVIARSTAADEEMRGALSAVGADWFDDLPEGLDTELGSEMRTLDVGQAQQLALARVMIADPHTLILDEATAMLDPTTARQAEQALSAVLEGRTVLAIAHRLHTAYDADRVVVMDAGRLTEIGTHHQLVSRGGTYASLWAAWHGGPPA